VWLLVRADEPLVFRAIAGILSTTIDLAKFIKNQNQPSTKGFLFEHLVCSALMDKFSGLDSTCGTLRSLFPTGIGPHKDFPKALLDKPAEIMGSQCFLSMCLTEDKHSADVFLQQVLSGISTAPFFVPVHENRTDAFCLLECGGVRISLSVQVCLSFIILLIVVCKHLIGTFVCVRFCIVLR
jgi:hypothetical protein